MEMLKMNGPDITVGRLNFLKPSPKREGKRFAI